MAKILVVNNDVDTMTLLQDWLERKNYTVKYTSNSEAVHYLVKEFRPNVVLVDILQKKVAEELKRNVETAEVPMLLMSGYTNSLTSLEVEPDDVIEKPFSLHLLQQKIENLLQQAIV